MEALLRGTGQRIRWFENANNKRCHCSYYKYAKLVCIEHLKLFIIKVKSKNSNIFLRDSVILYFLRLHQGMVKLLYHMNLIYSNKNEKLFES